MGRYARGKLKFIMLIMKKGIWSFLYVYTFDGSNAYISAHGGAVCSYFTFGKKSQNSNINISCLLYILVFN